ncbi:uncharacterized protein LOC142364931 isoform X4 [Opisthocomus hoazin]|uniref:uncharacterized protein LOC142364931 isoform X4 n=1 Tax=Opisthocomus hoazin TaxID=30419 RepID=UPI003F5308C0
MLEHSFSKEIFPNIQSEPPLTQLEGIATQRHQQGACVHRRFLAPSFLEFLKDGSPRVGPRAGDGKEQSSAPPGVSSGGSCRTARMRGSVWRLSWVCATNAGTCPVTTPSLAWGQSPRPFQALGPAQPWWGGMAVPSLLQLSR